MPRDYSFLGRAVVGINIRLTFANAQLRGQTPQFLRKTSMGPLAVQHSQSPRRKQSSSSESSPHSAMASPAVFPPLNLRSTSTGSRNSFLPHASFPQSDDSNDDAERRNATAQLRRNCLLYDHKTAATIATTATTTRAFYARALW
ncbi:hypothetical protein P3T76_010253 [Phytophthora citrophthora]|uniref:Uncharacterized protein n=1 Tax=Phytophthora citrophthora TaxID=4793 RepID=A0AAD9LG65_9STRA|nr:hypothetical protein P3T76_010253 [Phytophthora citrophthora]